MPLEVFIDESLRRDYLIAAVTVDSRELSGAATYEHLAPHEEPLLWVADGVAWAWGAGTDWRRRVAPLLADVRRIDP